MPFLNVPISDAARRYAALDIDDFWAACERMIEKYNGQPNEIAFHLRHLVWNREAGLREQFGAWPCPANPRSNAA